MGIRKPALAASAATLLAFVTAAGGARATTVATLPVSVSETAVVSSGQLSVTATGSGFGVLDDSGTFTITLPETYSLPSTPNETVSQTFLDIFTGTYSGGVFTATGGSGGPITCPSDAPACFLPLPGPFSGVSGSFTLADGGTLGTAFLSPTASDTSTYTVSAVPLPPAVWLLGSGLLGLLGRFAVAKQAA